MKNLNGPLHPGGLCFAVSVSYVTLVTCSCLVVVVVQYGIRTGYPVNTEEVTGCLFNI